MINYEDGMSNKICAITVMNRGIVGQRGGEITITSNIYVESSEESLDDKIHTSLCDTRIKARFKCRHTYYRDRKPDNYLLSQECWVPGLTPSIGTLAP